MKEFFKIKIINNINKYNNMETEIKILNFGRLQKKEQALNTTCLLYCGEYFFLDVWYFNSTNNIIACNGNFPWPVWPMFGWGIGLLFNYMDAYDIQQNN